MIIMIWYFFIIFFSWSEYHRHGVVIGEDEVKLKNVNILSLEMQRGEKENSQWGENGVKNVLNFSYMAICIGKLPYHIFHDIIFIPTNKICGLQEEAIEKIKQRETKVYLSKLQNIFVQIDKYVVCKKISQKDKNIYVVSCSVKQKSLFFQKIEFI